jgi:hypothetical protein
VQSDGAAGVGTVHDSIVFPTHDQKVQEPLGHSLLLLQICVEATTAVGHPAPPSPMRTGFWHDTVPVLVFCDARQQISPAGQSAASLHEMTVPPHAVPAAWQVSTPLF